MQLAMVPLLYTTLFKSSKPLSMVDPICAFVLTEQQLFPLSRLVVCFIFVCVCVLGLFLVCWVFFLQIVIRILVFQGACVWADLRIHTAPVKCEIQTDICLITFHLNSVGFGRKNWLSVLMLQVATTAFCT